MGSGFSFGKDMKCPNCKFEWKDERMVKGGKNSKRVITPEDQAKMQEGRKKAKKERNEPLETC